jgi:uroporphyrinogen-III decarboxylase
MTGKERVLSILNHQKPDRMAYVPCIDGYVQAGLPEKYRKMHNLDVQYELGGDMLRGPWCYPEEWDDSVTVKKTTLQNGSKRTSYTTPLGTIESEVTYNEQSPHIPFPTKHLVQTIDDLRIFNYMFDHKVISPDYREFEEAQKKYPDRVVATGVMGEGFQSLFAIMGLENFIYLFNDHPDEVLETWKIVQKKRLQEVAVTAGSPADVIICYEGTNTAASSIEWIEKYELPGLNEYAKVIHDHGKKMLVHMCGHINMVVDKIAQCDFDGILDVASAPTGDCNIPEALKTLGAYGKVMSGGIECTMYTQKDPDVFERGIRDFLETLEEDDLFMLGSGDAVPLGTSVQNLMRIRKLVESRKFSGQARPC